MNNSLNKLRFKYIITASVIVFFVIFLMILILNLLMRVTYKNEEKIIENVIEQSAVSRINQPITEYFNMSEAKQTENGDFIIPRNIRDVANITVYGNINIADSAVWYSAGGGLLFEANTDDGVKMVYKDYVFNKDTTNVSIDFEDYDNIKCDNDILSIDESQIISDYFLVSIVWWKKSANVPIGFDDDVSLNINRIEIHYKNQTSISSPDGSLAAHSSFFDIFENNIPQVLNNTSAFYLVVNKNKQIISINDGNLMQPIENQEAKNYVKQIFENNKSCGSIKKDNTVYSYTTHDNNDLKLIIFINDSFTDTSTGNLLKISLLIGILIWLILFVLIIIVSGYVVKPVADSMERQKQFISNASHELKTPITVISTTIDIIENKKGKDRWTECIKEQSKKMYHLVTELLDLSRLLEVHTARSSFKINNISNIISDSLLYFESMLFENGKTLTQDIENDITLNCDENKIAQLIYILMDNALKYSDDNSEISFSLKKAKDSVIINCANPCSNFSASDTSKLFKRFYRSDNDHSHETSGFGLGLSIAQAIAQLHNGTISASYKDNVISFTVILNC